MVHLNCLTNVKELAESNPCYTWIYEYLQPGGNYRNYRQSSGIPKKYSNTYLVIADYETAGGPCDLSMFTISPDTNPQRILQQLTPPSPRGGVRFLAMWCMSGAEKSIRSNVSHFLPSVCMILTLRCLQQLFRSWNGIHGRSFEEPEHQPSLSQATLARESPRSLESTRYFSPPTNTKPTFHTLFCYAR
ncbi:hypothetical protein M422DRAFT_249795 [Sphaerobolus stellatus SS14]|uniref:Unplaced genomic scaffold SPHSTscaffold_31, whole genome shotgun sequence n=1 Tax=Sphaerobolus stellatus (strain SS14) TaxID=990650 RepID=A0A0C9VUM3_SPHS4|nr:hypothetical protein M422DRAFT_249795 [Sphaerobolus stellatus SS14]